MSLAVATITLLLLVTRGFADEQFNCPNNGIPKVGSDGRSIQCLPGQSSDLICGAGYSCYFSGFNYQCCPTTYDEDHYHRDSSEQHRHDNAEHRHENNRKNATDEEQLNNGAECPDETFMVLTYTGIPIQCHPRTKPCPEKSMFCNKYSPIPVCCESVSVKRSSKAEKILAPSSKSHSALLPLVPLPLEANNLEQARLAPSQLENTPLTKQHDNRLLGVSLSPSSPSPALSPNSVASSSARTIVNHDMGINGECTSNSIIVLADDFKPIECSRTHRCPLKSLLCHRNNNGKRYCCQIVPRDEVNRVHSRQESSFIPADKESQQLASELKRQEKELARIDAEISKASQLSPPTTTSIRNVDISANIGSGLAPSIQPPAQVQQESGKPEASFADNDNESTLIPLPNLTSSSSKEINGGKMDTHVIAHAAKTHDRDDVNSAVDIDNVNLDAKLAPSKKPESTQDTTKIEYRPHNQGGYAIFEKRERNSPLYTHHSHDPSEDREQHKRLAQRFLLEQIKQGWPYDEKFYRDEEVVVMKQNAHPAAIVHFPN